MLTDHLDRSPYTDHLDRGILMRRIFKHGTWIPITIDAMLPCGPDGKVALCSSTAADELWPALLTKVVKLYGRPTSVSVRRGALSLLLEHGVLGHEPLSVREVALHVKFSVLAI